MNIPFSVLEAGDRVWEESNTHRHDAFLAVIKAYDAIDLAGLVAARDGEIVRLHAKNDELRKTADSWKQAAEKAGEFKTFVHVRFDSMEVPEEFPDGEHSKEGCRVGDRIDWIEKQITERDGEIARLKAEAPPCSHCGKPAVCIGRYEGNPNYEAACGDCCGHGCEDGHCYKLTDIPGHMDRREKVIEKAEAQLAERDAEVAMVRETARQRGESVLFNTQRAEKAEAALKAVEEDRAREVASHQERAGRCIEYRERAEKAEALAARQHETLTVEISERCKAEAALAAAEARGKQAFDAAVDWEAKCGRAMARVDQLHRSLMGRRPLSKSVQRWTVIPRDACNVTYLTASDGSMIEYADLLAWERQGETMRDYEHGAEQIYKAVFKPAPAKVSVRYAAPFPADSIKVAANGGQTIADMIVAGIKTYHEAGIEVAGEGES